MVRTSWRWGGAGMAGLALGYFLFYAPYSALAKVVAQGLLPGLDGRPVPGLELLPTVALGTVAGMCLFMVLSGWGQYARRRRVLGLDLPWIGPGILAAAFWHAIAIGATTLNYTFVGISILFVLLLMRGGVLILSPLVDMVRGRQVRRSSWIALGLSLAAVTVALADVDHYVLSLGAVLSLTVYFAGYIGRFSIMERRAKAPDSEVNRRYFVEEQMASSPWLLVLLALAAVVVPGEAGQELRRGFLSFPATAAALPAFLVGLLYAGLSVFGSLIYVDCREYTWCVPINRSSSLLAGMAAAYGLTLLLGLPPPSLPQHAAAGLVMVAITMLSVPELLAARRRAGELPQRLFLFVCSGNTCRSPMAEAIARAELAASFDLRPPLQVLSAGLAAREGAPMTAEAEVTLRALGVEPGRHCARPLTPELIARAEAIYCMTASLREKVLGLAPGAAGKTWCIDPEGDVPDPLGSTIEVYRSCAERLRELVRRRLDERLAEA
jgi:protein-tyrosine-phosphatase